MSYEVKLKTFPIDKNEILSYLDEKKIMYNDYFKLYLGHDKYKSVTSPCVINVVIVNLLELGLKQPSNFIKIKEVALKNGYSTCEPNLGFFLRLELKEQKKSTDSILSQQKNPDSAINVFSDKVEEEWEFPRSCYLRNIDDVLWIRASRFDDIYEFPLDSEFAFIKNT